MRQPDRRALDDVAFDVLGLTGGEREAACSPKPWRRQVYEAVVGLVRSCLCRERDGPAEQAQSA